MGKETVIIAINSLMSLPPVVGLVLYIIFSVWVLGFMDILYSPTIMILPTHYCYSDYHVIVD